MRPLFLLNGQPALGLCVQRQGFLQDSTTLSCLGRLVAQLHFECQTHLPVTECPVEKSPGAGVDLIDLEIRGHNT